jgi:hypothetical protein
VRRPEDVALFDRAFAVFWDRRRGIPVVVEDAAPVPLTLVVDDEDDGPEEESSAGDADNDEPNITMRFSAVEVLRHKDFAECSDAELHELRALMDDVRLIGATRRSRRMVASRRDRGRQDLRRTVRASLRAEGEMVRRHHLRPGVRPRRVVFLLDVSGSMEPYARALLRFVHAAVVGRQRVEAFALGTRLTRLTRELSTKDPDTAFERATGRVLDWSGGTRLGEGLRAFNDRWGVRGMARGATVVVLSDGWDRGDPDVLATQMQRLRRVAHRIVWVNPLKVTPGYAPLARGMAAALPFVDSFVEGHSFDALDRLAAAIAETG